MSTHNTDSDSDTDSDSKVQLTHRQVSLLAKATELDAAGHDPVVVSAELKAALSRLDGDSIDALQSADSPIVLDAADVSREKARDAIEAMRSIDDPVVVPRSEAESLQRAKDGLSTVVGKARGLDEKTTSSMSLDALASALESIGEDTAVESLTLSEMSQHPVTGGARPEEIDGLSNAGDGPRDPDSLTYDDRRELESLAKKYRSMKDRTPVYTSRRIEPKICDLLGVDHDDFEDVRRDVEAL